MKMSQRQLCFNTSTDRICLQITSLVQASTSQNGDVLSSQISVGTAALLTNFGNLFRNTTSTPPDR